MSHADFARWLYRGRRPNLLARFLNRIFATVASFGVAPNYVASLEVTGRKSGRAISLPVVIAVVAGQRYLVSMLGEEVDWVRNVRAANGRAVLYHGSREPIRLQDVAVAARAPLLKAYLQCAPGARPHVPVDKDAPLVEFERITASLPVFLIVAEAT